MPCHTFHFLNVKQGDCSIIEHGSGHVSVIDVCNARHPIPQTNASAIAMENLIKASRAGVRGNFHQRDYPVNPIEYLQKFGINSVFRFLVTHPDMDHMDGIKDFFEVFSPANYYDTDNTKEMEESWAGSPYRQEDWEFYKNLRDSGSDSDPKRLTIFSGDDGIHRRKDWNGKPPGDAFFTLAPTPELVEQANDSSGDYHDASYVIMYWGQGGRIILSGDSHDATWEHILKNHEDLVKDADLLIAPHHGRHSKRSYDFLDVVNPKMTFFGNANSQHLAYDPWRTRGLEFITNNQANCMVVDTSGDNLSLYVTYENFAKAYAEKHGTETWRSETYDAWYLKEIDGWAWKESSAAAKALAAWL